MNSIYQKVFKFVFLGLVGLYFQNLSQGQEPYPAQNPYTYINKYQAYYDYSRSQSWYEDVDSIYNPVTGQTLTVRTEQGELGLGIYDASGTQGPGIISESQGYAMILAALYNDPTTFRRLSATVQSALQWGNTGKDLTGSPTNLFPWFLSYKSDKVFQLAYNNSTGGIDANSASDADINIGIAYTLADQLGALYTANYSLGTDAVPYWVSADWQSCDDGSNCTNPYYRAQNYIGNIYLKDFVSNTSASLANRRILTDGAAQAAQGNIYNWHPDYSDPRAYEFFSAYEYYGTATDTVTYQDMYFWNDVQTYTKASWMALFDFGSTDTRTTWTSAPPTGQDISASTMNVFLNNATFGNLTFNSDYKQVRASRYQTAYDSDSCRMPVRQMNYIKAYQNWDDAQMAGIANSALEALGTSYTNSNYSYLTSNINIWTPWSQWYNYGVQDFMGSGLYAYAGNPSLPYSNRATVLQELETDFGTDGLNGTVSAPSSGYNALLTLWNLTTTYGGETVIQDFYEDCVMGTYTSGGYTYSTVLWPDWVDLDVQEAEQYYGATTFSMSNRRAQAQTLSSHILSRLVTRASDAFVPDVIKGKYKLTAFAGSPFSTSPSVKYVHVPSTILELPEIAFDGSAVKEVYYYGAPPVVVGAVTAPGFGPINDNEPTVYYSALKSGWPSSFMESQTTPFLDVAPGMTIPNFLPAKRSGVLNYKVSGLPKGLVFDRATGTISGRIGYNAKAGKYDVTVSENMNKKSLKANDYKIRFVVYKSRAELESKSISADSRWWTVLKVVSYILPIFSPF